MSPQLTLDEAEKQQIDAGSEERYRQYASEVRRRELMLQDAFDKGVHARIERIRREKILAAKKRP